MIDHERVIMQSANNDNQQLAIVSEDNIIGSAVPGKISIKVCYIDLPQFLSWILNLDFCYKREHSTKTDMRVFFLNRSVLKWHIVKSTLMLL
jgi:hypothetical protein